MNAAQRRALSAVTSGEIDVVRDSDQIGAEFYPDGWLERVCAIESGAAKPGDWKQTELIRLRRRGRMGTL